MELGDDGFDAGFGSLALVGQLLRKKADGPLAEALDLAGKHTLVVAARVSVLNGFMKRFPGGGAFPAEIVPSGPLPITSARPP